MQPLAAMTWEEAAGCRRPGLRRHPAGRRDRGTRPPPAAGDRRHHCPGDGAHRRRATGRPWTASPGAPSPDLHFGGLRAGLRRNALAPSRDRRGDSGGHRRQPEAARVHGARDRQRASRPRPPRVDRGRREPDPPRPAPPRGVPQPRHQAVGAPAQRRVQERRLPRRTVRDFDRAGRAVPTWCAKPRWLRCRRIRRRSPARSARARWSSRRPVAPGPTSATPRRRRRRKVARRSRPSARSSTRPFRRSWRERRGPPGGGGHRCRSRDRRRHRARAGRRRTRRGARGANARAGRAAGRRAGRERLPGEGGGLRCDERVERRGALARGRRAGSGRRAGQQRGRGRLDAASADLARRLESPPGGQRDGRVPLHPGLPARHAGAGMGSRGERRFDRGARRGQVSRRVFRGEARARGPHSVRGGGGGRHRSHGQRGVPGVRGYRHDRGDGEPDRREDRAHPGGSAGGRARLDGPAPADLRR